MLDLDLIFIMLLAFAAIATLVFAVAQHYVARSQLRRRLPVAAGSVNGRGSLDRGAMQSIIAQHFAEDRFGVDSVLRTKLRRELLRAGYFRYDAINYYIFARICTVIVLPLAVFLLLRLLLPGTPFVLIMAVVALSAFLGILGPDAYIARRQRMLAQTYRQVFPDLLDLLVVCVSAGLSLEAALSRVGNEMGEQNSALGMNLEMHGAEVRAGRSTLEALNSLADRLGLDEAASFVATLRQSIELGGDVGDALRVFSDEMRDKRLLRAEETANKLSVKLVIPLALFIFPVILMIVLLPVAVKLFTALSAVK
jgi:tight adherence protein C